MLSEIQPAGKNKMDSTGHKTNETAYFSVNGMWCAGCAAAAENVLRNQDGISDVDISFAAERGRLKYDSERVDIDQTLQRLDKLGYSARLLSDEQEEKQERQQEKLLLQLITAMAFSMQVMFFYIERLYPLYNSGQIASTEIRNVQYLVWGLSTPVLFIGGISILKGAWRAMVARTATMDTLVALGALSAYFYSIYQSLTLQGETYFDSVAMITTFIILGRYLEKIGGNQARKDIRRLIRLQPQKAWVKENGNWVEKKTKEISPNQIILVKTGERIPVDGEVVEGQASVNESVLTGESMPVEKGPGKQVYAGTLLLDNAVQVRVLTNSNQTRLAGITRLVEQTLSDKPPIQRLADKASGYFAFGILAIAIITGFGWIFSGASFSTAILHAVSVLVVACPCALGLATPLAITVTLGKASNQGVLIRNPAALESAGQMDRIVFDKTGTLTQGKMQVILIEINPELKISKEELLKISASVEQYSEHPIAQTITAACKEPLYTVHGFTMKYGLGVTAHVMGSLHKMVKIGSRQYLQIDENSPLLETSLKHESQGETVIWVGWDESIKGFIALRDTVNPKSAQTIRELSQAGVEVFVLSGDSQAATRVICQEVGINNFEGNRSPEEKALMIKNWQEDGLSVAMVGDGVNDAPALAQADLSITVAGGTDIAGETSDVILMRDELSLVPWFINLSRRTRKIIRENLGWAFAYNLVAVPLASFGLISPVLAAITMACSSLLVVGNSLRLRS